MIGGLLDSCGRSASSPCLPAVHLADLAFVSRARAARLLGLSLAPGRARSARRGRFGRLHQGSGGRAGAPAVLQRARAPQTSFFAARARDSAPADSMTSLGCGGQARPSCSSSNSAPLSLFVASSRTRCAIPCAPLPRLLAASERAAKEEGSRDGPPLFGLRPAETGRRTVVHRDLPTRPPARPLPSKAHTTNTRTRPCSIRSSRPSPLPQPARPSDPRSSTSRSRRPPLGPATFLPPPARSQPSPPASPARRRLALPRPQPHLDSTPHLQLASAARQVNPQGRLPDHRLPSSLYGPAPSQPPPCSCRRRRRRPSAPPNPSSSSNKPPCRSPRPRLRTAGSRRCTTRSRRSRALPRTSGPSAASSP